MLKYHSFFIAPSITGSTYFCQFEVVSLEFSLFVSTYKYCSLDIVHNKNTNREKENQYYLGPKLQCILSVINLKIMMMTVFVSLIY